jgi:hypothetical protein
VTEAVACLESWGLEMLYSSPKGRSRHGVFGYDLQSPQLGFYVCQGYTRLVERIWSQAMGSKSHFTLELLSEH